MFKIQVYRYENKDLVETYGVNYQTLEDAVDAQWAIDLSKWNFVVYFSIEKMEA